MIRVGIVVLAAVMATSWASPAGAQQGGDNPLIQRGETEYDELRFEEALQTLSAALIRAGNSRQQQATIYRLLAITYLALGRQEEAGGAYRRLLAIDPGFTPGSDLSPRVREFFNGVQQQWETDGRPGLPPPAPVSIRHRSPPESERNTAIELTAEVEDPGGRVANLVLAYRQGTSDVFQRVDTRLQSEGGYAATIPADAVAPPLVEYYFEAVNDTGLPVAQRGDVAAPLRVAVPEPGSSIFSQWWFWVGAAVLIGGAVTAGVLLAGGGDAQQQGTFVITVR